MSAAETKYPVILRLRVSEEQLALIKAEAAAHEWSAAHVVRRLIDQQLTKPATQSNSRFTN